jgi:phosphomevalonate kinase
MVTSLSGALFLHLISSSSQSPGRPTLQIIHNLAQYVHSLAQGKVGSGFDVSAAVWGSQVYRRFSETCLSDVLSKNVEDFKVRVSLPFVMTCHDLSRLNSLVMSSLHHLYFSKRSHLVSIRCGPHHQLPLSSLLLRFPLGPFLF